MLKELIAYFRPTDRFSRVLADTPETWRAIDAETASEETLDTLVRLSNWGLVNLRFYFESHHLRYQASGHGKYWNLEARDEFHRIAAVDRIEMRLIAAQRTMLGTEAMAGVEPFKVNVASRWKWEPVTWAKSASGGNVTAAFARADVTTHNHNHNHNHITVVPAPVQIIPQNTAQPVATQPATEQAAAAKADASVLSDLQHIMPADTLRIGEIAADKKLGTDEKCKAIVEIDAAFYGKTSAEWAKILSKSRQMIEKTDFWKRQRQEHFAAARALWRDRNPDGDMPQELMPDRKDNDD